MTVVGGRAVGEAFSDAGGAIRTVGLVSVDPASTMVDRLVCSLAFSGTAAEVVNLAITNG